jgi:hypothetical protein
VLTLDKGLADRPACAPYRLSKRCEEVGIRVVDVLSVENTMRGGYQGVLRFGEAEEAPDCLSSASDTIALGAVKGLQEMGVRMPDDLGLISTGNGDQQQEEFAVPSLSVVNFRSTRWPSSACAFCTGSSPTNARALTRSRFPPHSSPARAVPNDGTPRNSPGIGLLTANR